MKIIFLRDLKGQGKKDEVKEVKDGYALNFLIKKGYAIMCTEGSNKVLNSEKALRNEKNKKGIEEANEINKELSKSPIEFKVKTGKNDQVFGSISTKQISKKLEELGYVIDKKKIHIKDHIASIGIHDVKIELHKEVELIMKINLIKE